MPALGLSASCEIDAYTRGWGFAESTYKIIDTNGDDFGDAYVRNSDGQQTSNPTPFRTLYALTAQARESVRIECLFDQGKDFQRLPAGPIYFFQPWIHEEFYMRPDPATQSENLFFKYPSGRWSGRTKFYGIRMEPPPLDQSPNAASILGPSSAPLDAEIESLHLIDVEIGVNGWNANTDTGVRSKWGTRLYTLGNFVVEGGRYHGIWHEHTFYNTTSRGPMRIRNSDHYHARRTACQNLSRENESDAAIDKGTWIYECMRIRDVCLEFAGGGFAYSLRGRHDSKSLVENCWVSLGNTPDLHPTVQDNITGALVCDLSNVQDNPNRIMHEEIHIRKCWFVTGSLYTGLSFDMIQLRGGARVFTIESTLIAKLGSGKALTLRLFDDFGESNVNSGPFRTELLRLDRQNVVWGDVHFNDGNGRSVTFTDPQKNGVGYAQLLAYFDSNPHPRVQIFDSAPPDGSEDKVVSETMGILSDTSKTTAKASVSETVIAIPQTQRVEHYVQDGFEGTESLGLNLAVPTYYERTIPFRDVAKMMDTFREGGSGSGWLTVNSFGFPNVAIPGGAYAWALGMTDRPQYPGGRYLITWTGTATISVPVNRDVTSFQVTGPNSAEMVLTPVMGVDRGFELRVTANSAGDPIGNLKILHENDAASTNPFTEVFLGFVTKFRAIRFMNWALTNNSAMEHWADRSPMGYQTYGAGLGVAPSKGVPLELQCDLAVRANLLPWFNVPHKATDDFATQMATLIRDEYLNKTSPDRIFYLEVSNEVWNVPSFQHHNYFKTTYGNIQYPGDGDFERGIKGYAFRAYQIWRIFLNICGDRCIPVLGCQQANSYVAQQELDAVMDDAQPCSRLVRCIGINPYFGNALGDPTNGPLVVNGTIDLWAACEAEIHGNATFAGAEDIPQDMLDHVGLCNARTNFWGENPRIVGYEGSQHLVGVGGQENDPALTAIFTAANRDARMRALMRTHLLPLWKSGGADNGSTQPLIRELFLFSDVTTYTKFGSWGLGEDPYTLHDAVKARASLDWQTENPKFW